MRLHVTKWTSGVRSGLASRRWRVWSLFVFHRLVNLLALLWQIVFAFAFGHNNGFQRIVVAFMVFRYIDVAVLFHV